MYTLVTTPHTQNTLCRSGTPPASQVYHAPITVQDDEQALLGRVAEQNQQAFEILYTHYAPRVRGYLARLLRQPELSDEVLQDVMLVLWQRAATIPPTVPLGAWLCGVARRKASKAVARVAARPLLQATHVNRDEDEPEAVVLRQEYGRLLARALATLPLRERTALELLVYQGYSRVDIAAVTGAPVSTVRTRVARARHRLRARIASAEREHSGHRAS